MQLTAMNPETCPPSWTGIPGNAATVTFAEANYSTPDCASAPTAPGGGACSVCYAIALNGTVGNDAATFYMGTCSNLTTVGAVAGALGAAMVQAFAAAGAPLTSCAACALDGTQCQYYQADTQAP